MSAPTISCLIPTQGRVSLMRTLTSIEAQKKPGDEVIVIADTHKPLLDENLKHWVLMRKHRYLEHDAGHSCWGHCQLNHGFGFAKGDWITCIDDDDIYAPGAWDRMREAAAKRADDLGPILFQFRTCDRRVLWALPVSDLQVGRIGGHCLFQPNVPEKVGRFTCRYEGDFDWIQDTIAKWGGEERVQWIPDVIAIARPA